MILLSGKFLDSATLVYLIKYPPSLGGRVLNVVLTNDISFIRNVSMSENFSSNEHISIYFEIKIYIVNLIQRNERDVVWCNLKNTTTTNSA